MSDTHETDVLLSNQESDRVPYDECCDQLEDLCRKLERERNNAFDQIEELITTNGDLANDLWEWRKCAEMLANALWAEASGELRVNSPTHHALLEFEKLNGESK